MRRTAILCALAFATFSAIVPAQQRVSRHDAKLRTFAAFLHMTEATPDQIDATRAAITVGPCRRDGLNVFCRASLGPMLVSGIVVASCRYPVTVRPDSMTIGSPVCR